MTDNVQQYICRAHRKQEPTTEQGKACPVKLDDGSQCGLPMTRAVHEVSEATIRSLKW